MMANDGPTGVVALGEELFLFSSNIAQNFFNEDVQFWYFILKNE